LAIALVVYLFISTTLMGGQFLWKLQEKVTWHEFTLGKPDRPQVVPTAQAGERGAAVEQAAAHQAASNNAAIEARQAKEIAEDLVHQYRRDLERFRVELDRSAIQLRDLRRDKLPRDTTAADFAAAVTTIAEGNAFAPDAAAASNQVNNVRNVLNSTMQQLADLANDMRKALQK
jgi:hypothetical protein